MSALREAAQQALEALEQFGLDNPHRSYELEHAVIAALKAALAQQAEPVQEPITRLFGTLPVHDTQQAEPVEPGAWMVYTEGGASAYVTDNPRDLIGAYRALPLYTAPPQRKPLTEEEIDRICALLGFAAISPAEIVRAVERAHGIGEIQ